MNNFTKKLLSKPEISPNNSDDSLSHASQKSFKELISLHQVNSTLKIIHQMKFLIKKVHQNLYKKKTIINIKRQQNQQVQVNHIQLDKLKKSESENQLPSSRMDSARLINHQNFLAQHNLKSQIEIMIKQTVRKKQQNFNKNQSNKKTQDEYMLGQLQSGKRAYFDFLTNENEIVELYSNQSFQDLKDYMKMQDQIEGHQSQNLHRLKNIINKSQRSLLKQKLDKILWEQQLSLNKSKQSNSPTQSPKSSIVKPNKRGEVLLRRLTQIKKTTKIMESQRNITENNKLDQIKSTAQKYLVRKFKKYGQLNSTLSKSSKLKPIKLVSPSRKKSKYMPPPSQKLIPDPDEISKVYNYKELEERQRRYFEKVKNSISRKNREYLQHDLREISTFVNSSSVNH